MKKIILFTGILTAVYSWGSSDEEIKEKEKAIQDSLKLEAQKFAEQRKIHEATIEDRK